MKKLFILVAAVLLSTATFAQAPQLMSYQTVVRNASGTLVTSTSVGARITILQGSATGTAVYSEVHEATTNVNGLLSLVVGNGEVTLGDMDINWGGGPYFIQTEIDPTGGNSYAISSVSQLLSVPYALVAGNGTPGAPGIEGLPGTSGNDGAQGAQGAAGNDGAQGPQGEPGEAGPQGPQGPQGMMGLIGMGMPGMPGMSGMPGPQGPAGDPGEAGPEGPQGIPGNTGPQGATGATALLPDGSTVYNTPYWNGTAWVINNRNISNTGGGVGIGTTNPMHQLEVNGNAKVNGNVKVQTTMGGVIVPRLTTAQVTALTPVEGMIIFNTTTLKFQGYASASWVDLH